MRQETTPVSPAVRARNEGRKLRLEKKSAFSWPQMPKTETCNRMKNSADEEVTEFDSSRD